MDLNYLYGRHQASLANAANAGCDEARRIHRELARAYASLIAAKRPRPAIGDASWNG